MPEGPFATAGGGASATTTVIHHHYRLDRLVLDAADRGPEELVEALQRGIRLAAARGASVVVDGVETL